MTRTKKRPEERRAELVATARQLFSAKGVDQTSISDIVKTVGVAQGTFYWYFSSKDEILNVVVEEIVEEICNFVSAISQGPKPNAMAKFLKIKNVLFDDAISQKDVLEHIHRAEHVQFHDYLVMEINKRLIPIVTEVIKQGVEEGVFNTPYPEDAAAFILLASQALHEEDIFSQNETMKKRVEAYFDFVVKGLGCKLPIK